MMKWIVIYFLEFFSMYSKVEILVIWNNQESGVLMNGNVKCVDIYRMYACEVQICCYNNAE
jgi:hypothetical protein